MVLNGSSRAWLDITGTTFCLYALVAAGQGLHAGRGGVHGVCLLVLKAQIGLEAAVCNFGRVSWCHVVARGPGLRSQEPHFAFTPLLALGRASMMAGEGCMAMCLLRRTGALGRGENGTLLGQLFTLHQNLASDFTSDLDLDL